VPELGKETLVMAGMGSTSGWTSRDDNGRHGVPNLFAIFQLFRTLPFFTLALVVFVIEK
jgi:hypothetical protein